MAKIDYVCGSYWVWKCYVFFSCQGIDIFQFFLIQDNPLIFELPQEHPDLEKQPRFFLLARITVCPDQTPDLRVVMRVLWAYP